MTRQNEVLLEKMMLVKHLQILELIKTGDDASKLIADIAEVLDDELFVALLFQKKIENENTL